MRIWCVMLAVIGGMGSASARADDPPVASPPAPPVAPPAPPASTVADLQAWLKDHKSDIEAIAGAKFATDIPVRTITTDDLATMIATSIAVDMVGAKRADGSSMGDIEIRVRSTAAAYKLATRTLGVYSREDRAVYIVPANASAYGKRYGWAEQTIERVPRLALAHELVHALQDQKAGVSERLAGLTGEERVAFTGVIEGHAVWVTDRLAEKLGWTAANGVLWGVVTAGRSDDDVAQKNQPPAVPLRAAPTMALYTWGRAYMEGHAKQAGADKAAERLWSVLASPPTTLAQLKSPPKASEGSGGAEAAAPPKPASAP